MHLALKKNGKKNYLHVLNRFLYQGTQTGVCAHATGLRVTVPVRSQVADHQIKVVPLQPSKPERLADRADL